MAYLITHKRSYDTEFVELPKNLQKRVLDAIDDLKRDPVTVRGNTVKALRGYDNVWRYRLGDHRLIYSVAPDDQVIQLLAVGPRGSVYERFNYEGWEDDSFSLTFGSDLPGKLAPRKAKAPEYTAHPEWFQPQAPEPAATPLPQKLTPSRLRRWRVPEAHHDTLMRCLTEEALMAADVPSAVLERVLEALWPPSVAQLAQQPDLVLFDPADLERYAAGELHAFLLHLDEEQRRYTDWALSGPTLVKGGPGSGKSTVALYRVRAVVEKELARQQRQPSVLFTTYTNALVNFSDSLLRQLLRDPLGLAPDDPLPPGIHVATLDSVVNRILHEAGRQVTPATPGDRQDALRDGRRALLDAASGLEGIRLKTAVKHLRDDYLLEEFKWVIEGQDCRTLDDYLAADRVGRAVPFDERMRAAVWQLYRRYADSLARQARRTWGQMRQMALEAVRSGAVSRCWDYVVVDEAQDLTPAALALCVELCCDPSGVFLTADANQSLYNRGFRWRNVHEQLQVVGRTRILRRNYRTTREIAQAAAEILTGSGDADPDALTQTYVHSGVPPQLYGADGAAGQGKWLAGEIVEALRTLRLPLSAAAVLAPSNALASQMAQQLQAHGLEARFMRSRDLSLDAPGVKVMTLHAAKGLEFPIVAVVHAEADRLPAPIPAAGEEELAAHAEAQRRLFYVGCTRAMRYLFITFDRWLPSPFVTTLSDDRWLRYG